MSTPLAEGTWRAGLERVALFECGEAALQTGYERVWIGFTTVEKGRVPVPTQPGATPSDDDLSGQAAALAVETPHVASAASPAPRLSGNLAEDVHAVTGLTWAQIAAAFKVSERAAAGWRAQGVPTHRQETMEALRAIGVILVGGLGPTGVAQWLTAGRRSRLTRVRNGEVEAVAREAQSYRDAPAT